MTKTIIISSFIVVLFLIGYQQYQIKKLQDYNNEKITIHGGGRGFLGNASYNKDEALTKLFQEMPNFYEKEVSIPLKVPYKTTEAGFHTCYGEANCPPEVLIKTKELTTSQAVQLIIDYLNIKYVEGSSTPAQVIKDKLVK